jgi:hypothetical protein
MRNGAIIHPLHLELETAPQQKEAIEARARCERMLYTCTLKDSFTQLF